MAKIKYDVSDVEAGADFDTPVPVGAYRCKITDCKEGESKSSGNPMLTVEYEISTGEHKGRKFWDYIVLNDSSAWKLRQLTDALGKRAKGTLDTNAIIGERVVIKAKHETDDRDPDNPVVRAKVGSVNPIPEDQDEEEDDEPEDDDDDVEEGDDDEEDDEGEEDEDEDEDEDDEDGEDELTLEDLEEYDRDDLESLVEEEELDIKFNKRTKDDVLRERIAEALELSPEDEEDDEEEDEDEEDEEDEVEDYSDLTISDLLTELKSRGLNTKTKLKGDRKKALFIKRLEKDDEDGDEPF